MNTDTPNKTYSKHLLRYRDPVARLAKIKAWKKANQKAVRETDLRSNAKAKSDALGHYGKSGAKICCWPGCTVSDEDMLTLDHVANDGAKHRVRGKGMTGIDIYRKLRMLGWPAGFQTLCWNHQWKKEIIRRREKRY